MKAFDVGQSESNDLPADQVAHLGKARPNQVDRQAVSLLHGAAGKARLLHPVEDGEGAGVEEGEVPQLTVLVAGQLVGHQLGHILLKQNLNAGRQGLVLGLNGWGVLLNLVAQTLLMFVILNGCLQKVAPLLMLLLALLNVLWTPGHTVTPGTVLQGLLVGSSLSRDCTHSGEVAQIHLILLQLPAQLILQCPNQSVSCQLITNVLHSQFLH